jgi:RNA polymerase sigma-70 factor (ECF subfamily)
LQPIFDAAWHRRALEGDPEAVRALAGAVLQPLYSFCFYRVGRNCHLCEEVVQETMVRPIRDLQCYEPARARNNIWPWLTGLARNEVQRTMAREKTGVSFNALWARMDSELLELYARLDSEPLAEDVLMREETRALVNATMSQLPPHYRTALEAKYLNGRTVRDLATTLGASDKAVESLLTRARKAFRATFLALTRNLGTENL